MDELIAALAETGATLAFDAIGGGKLASQILSCMEAAATAAAAAVTAGTDRPCTSRSTSTAGWTGGPPS